MAQGRVRGKVAKAAITAALTGVMAFGGAIGPVTTALADDPTYKMDIVKSTADGAADTYRYFAVFKGTLNPSKDGLESSTITVTDGMRNVLEGFLDTDGADTTSSPATPAAYRQWLQDKGLVADASDIKNGAEYNQMRAAKNMADYISERISADAEAGALYDPIINKTDPVVKIANSGSFAERLAAYISEHKDLLTENTDYRTTEAGTVELEGGASRASASMTSTTPGFYLFLKQNENTDVTTRPVWSLVGGTVDKILEKAGQPTILKEVQEENTNEWGKIADASYREDVDYRITATTAAGTGYYQVEDHLPDGLVVSDVNNIKVSVLAANADAGTTPTVLTKVTDYNVTYFESKITVKFEAGTSSSEAKIKQGDTVYIEYQVFPSDDATMGTGAGAGQGLNVNEAVLKFGTVKPDEGDESTLQATTTTAAAIATYQIEIDKAEKTGEDLKMLKDAEFTVSQTSGSDTLYLQADGSMGTEAYTFKSDKDGKINVPHIDSGTYTITETKAPDGYKLIQPFELTITATKDTLLGKVTDLKAETQGKVYEASADIESGLVKVTVLNDREIVLPITGLTPSQLGTIIGLLLVAGGAAGLMARNRREQGTQA